MTQLAEPVLHSITFMGTGHGDLTITWDETNQAAMIDHIQGFMDKGIVFYKIEEVATGKIRKKTTTQAAPISGTGEITDRKLLVKDAQIATLMSAGIADIARFEGVAEIKTVGRATTAAEVAASDTIATKPKTGG